MPDTRPNVKNRFEQSNSSNSRDNLIVVNDKNAPISATFSPAAGAANVNLTTITITDGHGNAVAGPVNFTLILSDAATGIGLTSTSASGAVAAGAKGTVLGALTAKKALFCQTDADGQFILSITDTAKTAFYIAVEPTFSNQITVSDALETADYGS